MRTSVAAALAVLLAGPAAAEPRAGLDWAFPNPPAGGGGPQLDTTPNQHVAGSSRAYSEAQLKDLFHTVDWFPQRHPAPPPIVMTGRQPDARACGFCHLPMGEGRPENATLAGLPAAYIRRQLDDMRAGRRSGLHPDWRPTALMHAVAVAVTPAETAAAADYFARMRFVSRLKVVEASTIPAATAGAGVYRFAAGALREPLGQRIVEGPTDFEAFERRDPNMTYVAYAPPGALARGADLAKTGGHGRFQPCSACHGAGLTGGPTAPPLAGRSPSYMVRQLAAFASGARASAAAAPMRDMAQKLSSAEMIDVAAYAGSLKP